MGNKFLYLFLLCGILISSLCAGCSAANTSPVAAKEPVVIGLIANLGPSQGRNTLESMNLAANEINAGGGILGRKVVIVSADSKGETSLAVQAVSRLVIGNNAKFYQVLSSSEVALACKEKSAEMFPQYPHILFANQCKADAVMANIIEKYDKYKFFFGDVVSEVSNLYYFTDAFQIAKEVVGAKKIAILYDDLLWSKKFREGFPEYNIPSCDTQAKEDWGLEVVYSKALKVQTGMYLPILEQIAQSGAEFIYVPCCGFRDSDVLVKQWAESTAANIPLKLLVGPSELGDKFTQMTGGKCLGSLSTSRGMEAAMTSKTIPFIKKCKEKGLDVDASAHWGYSDVYFIKSACESAGSIDDINALIKGMETVESEGTLGFMKMTETKQYPFYHGGIEMKLDNLKQMDSKRINVEIIQYQENGPVVIWPKNLAQGSYKSPVELRKGKTALVK